MRLWANRLTFETRCSTSSSTALKTGTRVQCYLSRGSKAPLSNGTSFALTFVSCSEFRYEALRFIPYCPPFLTLYAFLCSTKESVDWRPAWNVGIVIGLFVVVWQWCWSQTFVRSPLVYSFSLSLFSIFVCLCFIYLLDATEAGRKHFEHQLLSIRYCVQVRYYFCCLLLAACCLILLLNLCALSGNMQFRRAVCSPLLHKLRLQIRCEKSAFFFFCLPFWLLLACPQMTRNLRPFRMKFMAMQHDIMMYAGCQKEGLGFDKIVEEAKLRCSRYNVQPNLLITPPQLSYYITMVPEEKIRYDYAGAKGPTTFENSWNGF